MLANCCCCVPLRTGSIILGVFGIVGSIVSLIASDGYWFYIIDSIFYLLAYGALLLGAIKYSQRLVLVNLVLTALVVFIGIVFGIGSIAFLSDFQPELKNSCATIQDELINTGMTCDEVRASAIGTTCALFFIASGLDVYFWICTMSFYKQLKTVGGN